MCAFSGIGPIALPRQVHLEALRQFPARQHDSALAGTAFQADVGPESHNHPFK